MTIVDRLAALRTHMKEAGIKALIIPSNDPHQSEYVADCWKTRTYFSGFTGSAGLVIVLEDYAALWTDSRYFLQAETELVGTGVTLHKQDVQKPVEYLTWTASRLKAGDAVGVEASLFSVQQIHRLNNKLQSEGLIIKNVEGITSKVWTDRPALPDTIAYEHDVVYTGHSRADKLAALRAFSAQYAVDHYLVTALDEIAWLLNIRAWDIEYTPVVLSYLLVSKEAATLFVQAAKVPAELKAALAADGVQLKDYHDINTVLAELSQNDVLYADEAGLSWAFEQSIQARLKLGPTIIAPMMARKNPVEIAHIKRAMVKDGVALTHLFMWLEETLLTRGVKETELAEVLTNFRSQQDLYKGDSFPAIVGYKGNGAIVHYRAEEATCATIENEGMLLLDSGGQYLDGTTDITRTVCFGEPTAAQKKAYTLVLKGNIALQRIHFPKGITGAQLDVLARMNLWNQGMNYGHGTGHGVGFFLRVHEPPQGFAPNIYSERGRTALEAGTLSSNEPGYYETNEFGIRIENLMICKPSDKNPDFLMFEAVTLFPIATNLIDLVLMEQSDIDWLNEYHADVYAKLSPALDAKQQAWLKEKCAPIAK